MAITLHRVWDTLKSVMFYNLGVHKTRTDIEMFFSHETLFYDMFQMMKLLQSFG